jgi:hypothetical protein
MKWFQRLHGIITIIPWLVVFFIRDPSLLLLSIMIEFFIVIQWVLLGGCILNPIENNGSKYSALHEWFANQLGIDIRDFNKGSILITNVAPTCAMAGILFGLLARKSRIRPASSRHCRS